MERKVNQKEFNELVLENVEEFEMEELEAIDFAVSQLEAQGVNLSNVITDVEVVRGLDAIHEFSKLYQNTKQTDKVKIEPFLALMVSASSLADKDTKYKLYSGKMDVHTIILNFAKWRQNEPALVKRILPCLENTIRGYPDLVDESTILFLINLFNTHQADYTIQRFVSSILLESIKQHERNKEIFFNNEMTRLIIKSCLQKETDDDVCTGCDIITNLCIDDDIRVEISNAHPRATSLADEFLIQCYRNLKLRHVVEKTTALIKAVTAMAVTNQLVIKLYEEDQEYKIVTSLINDFRKEKTILSNINKLLVALSGNDDCKSSMAPLIPLIITVVDDNLASSKVIQSSFLITSSLSLRSKPNALAFIELNAVEKIVQAMKVHKLTKLRKYGCMALRNMASSSKMPRPFEDSGALELINDLLESDKDMTEECKSVLVALGAPVTLTERWTGKRGDVVGGNEKLPEKS